MVSHDERHWQARRGRAPDLGRSGARALVAGGVGPKRVAAGRTAPPRLVTSWPWADPYGCFAEGLALGRDGNLYASVTTWGDEADVGQIVRVAPGEGAKTAVGPSIDTPGLLTGVAFDQLGRLYVADATFSATDPPGVFRIDAQKATRVLTLPADSFPNGIAFSGGSMYVFDSALGAVWRSRPDSSATPTTPWFQDARLLPGSGPDDHGIGANGIAVRSDGLYVAVSDAGPLARVAIRPKGRAGALRVVAKGDVLRTVDGIAFEIGRAHV